MARKSKTLRYLEAAVDLLVGFDKYFRDIYYHRDPNWFDWKSIFPLNTQKGIWKYIEEGILDKSLNVKQKPESVYKMITKPWDGWCRLVIFDIPEKDNVVRDKIRGTLKDLGFAKLQQSVWISFLPVDKLVSRLDDEVEDSKSLFIFNGRIRQENPSELAQELWLTKEWEEDAKDLRERMAKVNKLSNLDKSEFWELVARHPKVPLNLLPVGWPLRTLIKEFKKRK